MPPLQCGIRHSGPAPWKHVQVGPAQRRRHLLPHHPADAVPGPEIFPVPFVPGRPRPGLGQGEVRAGRPAASGSPWPALRRPAPSPSPMLFLSPVRSQSPNSLFWARLKEDGALTLTTLDGLQPLHLGASRFSLSQLLGGRGFPHSGLCCVDLLSFSP